MPTATARCLARGGATAAAARRRSTPSCSTPSTIHAPDLAELRRLLEAGVDPDGHRGELTGATALGW